MRYTILIQAGPNALKLDKKMIGKKSAYMVNSLNHIIAPKSILERIDVAAVLEDGYGAYYYRMKGPWLSYLFAIRDFGQYSVWTNLIQ